MLRKILFALVKAARVVLRHAWPGCGGRFNAVQYCLNADYFPPKGNPGASSFSDEAIPERLRREREDCALSL